MTLEKTIQTEILAEFGTRDDMRLWRVNTGVALPLGSERVTRFGVRGQADLSGIIRGSGRRLEIEVKSPMGRVSTQQSRWGQMIIRFGGIYIVARSIHDVYAGLHDAGVYLAAGGGR